MSAPRRGAEESSPGSREADDAVRDESSLKAYAAACAMTALATSASLSAFGPKQLADAVMLYLLGVVLISMRFGYGPSLLAAVFSVLCFDFFFVPPRYTFVVQDLSHVVTFAVMFLVALVISGLTQRVRAHAEVRVRLEREARLAQVRADTEQVRSALLSSVSHDLRTPLAVMTGAASALLDDSVAPEARRELSESILLEAQRLNHLVRNLLDMTRLDGGAVRVNKEWMPLEEVFGSALERLDSALTGREVEIDLAPELPLVPLDPVLMQQVLVNLLENALKYTPPGSPLTLAARQRPADVELVVSDRGPGIPIGEEERIFEKFYRVAQGDAPGVGLGLAICRAIVIAHSGRMYAQNRLGGGAEFHVVLPLEGEAPQLGVES